MKVADFDFFLPKELIARRPLKERDRSRLLVLHRDGMVEHRRFSDLPAYLDPGDLLLINNTKVFPAGLTGYKKTGGRVSILLVKEKGDNVWEVLSEGRFTGTLRISEELQAELYDGKTANFQCSGDFMDIIWKCGSMPLPPYIRRLPDESDKERYQTVYAKEEGSIAAPTAGLHFTERLLKEITSKGIVVRELTLHVGIGTFRPIRSKNVEEHFMDPEYFEIDDGLISEIKKIKESGKKIISVGTTTTRAIEGFMSGRCSLTSQNGRFKGRTDIFIYPGYILRVVDSLITNFHLPGSTPLMLASALCGWEKLKKSYEGAIAAKYRFFSYGDAMLIL
ncbi:MAG: tRNA preQ1(34) S-adenosylmethionine ribosyltransferase-isomerase QueA [Nitrospirota bacterium]